jgi:hypothetical protein
MRKQDRALKLKGYRQVDLKTDRAIHTTSKLKNGKGKVVRTIERAWKR